MKNSGKTSGIPDLPVNFVIQVTPCIDARRTDFISSFLSSFPSLSLNLLEFITAAVNQRGGNRVGGRGREGGGGGGAWLNVDVDSFLNLRNC